MTRATKIPVSRRHPADGGYARGEEARSRIIQVALQAFGQHGYDGASTRVIADLAGMNAPALQYYFGGKPSLYSACADHIAQAIGSRLAPSLADAREALSNGNTPKDTILLQLHSLLSEMLDMLLGPDAESWALFILREQAHPTPAFDAIYDKIQGPVIRTCAALIARLADIPESDPQAAVAALSLYGQVNSFRIGREAVLRVLGTRKLTPAHHAQIKSGLLRQLTAFMR